MGGTSGEQGHGGRPQITVSLLEWLRTGQFGPVRIGIMMDELEALLGPPEYGIAPPEAGRGPASASAEARVWRVDYAIWMYGNVELGFHGLREGLKYVHIHNFWRVPEGGRALALDPWVIRKRLPRREFERALSRAGIAHQVITPPRFDNGTTMWDEDEVRIAVGPGVAVTFQRRWQASAPPPGLVLLETRTGMY